jgi:hypothetical protein
MADGDESETKAVIRCTGCETIVPAFIRADETIHPIGMPGGPCCEKRDYRVLSR